MLGQFFPPLAGWAGTAWEVAGGRLVGVVELLEVAALAIAAPPPPTAAVTASTVSKGLIFEGISITSFGGLEHTMGHQHLSRVGQR
jgi:hypothetical protein